MSQLQKKLLREKKSLWYKADFSTREEGKLGLSVNPVGHPALAHHVLVWREWRGEKQGSESPRARLAQPAAL